MAIYNESMIHEGLSHPLYLRQWLPEGEIFGLVQLCHGMAEHGARYDRLGRYLADHGYASFCHDHRGHGKSCLTGETLGYFADKGGWDLLVTDTIDVGRLMRDKYCDGRFLIFGHSMGSLIVSAVAAREEGEAYDGFILSGSPAPNAMARVGMAVAKGFCRAGMARRPNPMLHAMAFADVNKRFKAEKSGNAWLSSDRGEVAKYDGDPLCGFRFTSSGFYDLFTGIAETRSKNWALKTRCKPFLLISGQQDPIGDYGKGVSLLAGWLREVGREVACILYPHKRHEILNELDCDKVYTDIISWILEEERYE